jgi:hypothetical protein
VQDDGSGQPAAALALGLRPWTLDVVTVLAPVEALDGGRMRDPVLASGYARREPQWPAVCEAWLKTMIIFRTKKVCAFVTVLAAWPHASYAQGFERNESRVSRLDQSEIDRMLTCQCVCVSEKNRALCHTQQSARVNGTHNPCLLVRPLVCVVRRAER